MLHLWLVPTWVKTEGCSCDVWYVSEIWAGVEYNWCSKEKFDFKKKKKKYVSLCAYACTCMCQTRVVVVGRGGCGRHVMEIHGDRNASSAHPRPVAWGQRVHMDMVSHVHAPADARPHLQISVNRRLSHTASRCCYTRTPLIEESLWPAVLKNNQPSDYFSHGSLELYQHFVCPSGHKYRKV